MIGELSSAGAGGPTIRPARPGDYAAARALAEVSGFEIPSTLAREASFAEVIAPGGVYIATADLPIGLLIAQPIAYDGDRPYTLWIELIIVHPSWRRRGVGTALYRALGGWARQLGIHGALTARRDEPAADALHRRVGFVAHRDDLLLWRFDE